MSVAALPTPALTPTQQRSVEAALPALRRFVKKLTPRFAPHRFDELFQIAGETASRVVHRHDPSRSSFITFCIPRVLGEIVDFAEKDRRQRARLKAMQRTLADVSEVFSDGGDPFGETPAQRLARMEEIRDAMGAALALGLLPPTTPEDAYLAEEERARTVTLAEKALASLGAEHAATARSYFFEGRSLDAIFAERGEAYFAARQRFIRALARVGRALRG